MSPFNFHELQSHVFSPCMHFTGYFSWISGPGFQPLWVISTFILSCSLTPRILSLSTASFTRTALQVTLGISANLSWTHSQTHHKTWDPEISSHTSLFWTLPEQLSKLQRAFPKSVLNQRPKKNTTKPQTLKFHLAHPCFELCRNSSPSYSAHCRKSVLNQCPKINPTKPQTWRFHLTHPCFELCRNSSPSYSAHFRKSVLNQRPKKNPQNLRPQDFISHIPVLNSAGTALQVTARISANLS